jgi:predicted dehydrogenase
VKVLRDAEEDGYLDQTMIDGWLRIKVVKVTQYPSFGEQFFRRQFDFRFALAYARNIGLLNAVRKVRSRLAERVRNERCIVVGLGRIIESGDPDVISGSLVPFIAPDSGPPSERYVVRSDLVGDPWRGEVPGKLPGMWQVVRADAVEGHPDISRIAGWHGYSGAPWLLSKHEIEAMVDRALRTRGRSTTCADSRSPVTERTETARESGLTIFGYGNYVKTIIIPQLGRRIPVRCVHEIDPWQIGRNRNELWSWDTSPGLRPDEHPDVVVVASFHHTHVKIAVEAMERGARAVIIEKPIVTTSADLELLCAAVEKYGTPVFVGFQRRYSPFNEHILADLRIRPGEPVSCFGIAYEVPLPPQHWYRWPNSGSRIISNGCHWIDHFLYLNDFSPARQVAAEPLGEASTLIRITLENEAVLSLSLTDEGSPRLGVREHCEFRANGVTATVMDARNYMSESARGVIRKAHVHRFSAYQRMYRSMCEAIAAGADGDSLQSLGQSSHSVLAAEAALADAANWLEGPVSPAASMTRPSRPARSGGFSLSHGPRSP